MKNGYEIDIRTNTLTVTKQFEKKSKEYNSTEYNLMKAIKRDFPQIQIVSKAAPKKRKSAGRISYDQMVNYLSVQSNAVILLKEFNAVREMSKSQNSPYNYVKDWFETSFPDYAKIPQFDENGEIIRTNEIKKPKFVKIEEVA